ncbi:MAG: hypothetical protein NZ822_01870 [Patescibacteria group bacterium]|nr:hypothetical protein [Patescibacteria group bacterium]
MKKIRFLITFVYFSLIIMIIILTVYFVFRITTQLTDLYFKNLEENSKSPPPNLTTNEIEKILQILRDYKVI